MIYKDKNTRLQTSKMKNQEKILFIMLGIMRETIDEKNNEYILNFGITIL
jgi:hypothetical protein